MKKIFLSIVTLTFLALSSCVSDSDSFNDDAKKSYDASAESLLSNAQKQLTDQLTTPSVNNNPLRYYVQYWAATLYTAESRYNLTTREIPDEHWTELYQDVLGNLQTSEEVLKAETKPADVSESDWQKQQQNKVAILEILKVYTYQILVDTFGDVPYTESLQNPTIILPKYDNDSDIYPKLITRIDAAISKLDVDAKSFNTGDLIYKGNVSAWLLFANSVKLKLGTNISDINPSLAKTTIESAYAGGVLLKNTDNALLTYASFSPNYNPVFDNLIASQRNDFVPANTLVNRMNELSDPRRPIFFTPMADGTYKGGVPGGRNSLPYETTYSHVGDVIKKPDAAGVLLEAVEVNFYLAEAAARGYDVGNTPEYYYNQAITLSCEFWGVIPTDIAAYLANPEVAYTTAASTQVPGAPEGTTGTGTWQEKIGYQEWIALYNRSFQSWTAFRRLDFPKLISHPSSVSIANKKVPVRWTYPTAEQTVNGANWTAASTAIGGDNLTTGIFWDTKL
jgi:hypothetical protein